MLFPDYLTIMSFLPCSLSVPLNGQYSFQVILACSFLEQDASTTAIVRTRELKRISVNVA